MNINLRVFCSLKLSIFIFLSFLLTWGTPLVSQERFRRSPPYPEPLPELNLPDIESTTLSNGLSLSVVRRENLQAISLRLIILAGESSSPKSLPSLATITANMLSKGALNLSSSEIEEAIESIGGNFSSSIYPDYSIFSFSFLEDYLDDALEILSRMILQPTFSKQEIRNVERSMFYDLVMKSTDPEFLARRLFFQILFKDHPYKNMAYNEDIIKKIDQKNILSFFNKFYIPNNAKLVLTGNLNLQTASKKVSKYLQSWKKKDLEYRFIPPPDPLKELKICFIDLPKAKDVTIYMGNIIFPITDVDLFPFVVLNQVLGGTPNSRLFMNLRESKGYAYHAFSELEFFKSCGIFTVKARVRPEVSYASIIEILKEIEKITKEKIPSYEIEQAKSYLIGNFPLKIETIDKLSSKISEIQAFNLGEKHWNKYLENIKFINSDTVSKIEKKYPLLSPVVIIIGNKNIIDFLGGFEKLEVYNSKGIHQYNILRGENK